MNNLPIYSQHTVIAPLREPFNDTPCPGNGCDVSLEGFFMCETRLIPLTQGQFAIVDAEDYDFLIQWKWYAHWEYNSFYALRKLPRINGRQKCIAMHRIVNATPDDMETDHINGNGLDNRKRNLRSVTTQQNQWNQRAQSNVSSAHKGVCWNKNLKKWQAQIWVNNKCMYLGVFDSENKAAEAYNAVAMAHRGQFHNCKRGL